MLVIRLSRIGKKKQPYYRLTITERRRDPYGRVLEILGSYNPRSKELQAKKERIHYWLGVGAQMTPTANNLLVSHKIIKGPKVKASRLNSKKAKAGAKPAADSGQNKAEAAANNNQEKNQEKGK